MAIKHTTLSVVETTGKLDRLLSEMILLAKSELDEPDWQTLKHHAEDMELAAKKVLELYSYRAEYEGSRP